MRPGARNEYCIPSFQRPRLLQRPRCRRRRNAAEEEDSDDILVDRLCFSNGSGRGSKAFVVPESVAGVCLRNLLLKNKRGDSSPHGPDR